MAFEPRCRLVEGLLWAQKAKASPWPKAKLSGTALQGKRFENRIARALPAAEHGPWFEFCDSNGKGFCSPDLVLRLPKAVLLLEVKLTWTFEAVAQLFGLYRPILAKVEDQPIFCGVILQGIGRERPPLPFVSSLREMFFAPPGPLPPVLLVPPGPAAHVRRQLSLAP